MSETMETGTLDETEEGFYAFDEENDHYNLVKVCEGKVEYDIDRDMERWEYETPYVSFYEWWIEDTDNQNKRINPEEIPEERRKEIDSEVLSWASNTVEDYFLRSLNNL